MTKQERIDEIVLPDEEKHLLYARGYAKGAEEKEVEIVLSYFQKIEEAVKMRLDDEKEETRKETAKEILQMLIDHTFEDNDGESSWTWTISRDDVKFISEKYGVEVEE